jgi:branched-chain amino acid transport system substrate-binding protein
MRRKHKRLLWKLGIIVIIIVVLLVVFLPRETEKEVIKIGVVNPLSGNVAYAGEEQRKGLDLALEEINKNGGVNGREVELIYEDGMCQPATASKIAHKLITVDKVVAIIGSYCSSSCLAMAPIAEENKIILMASGMSPEIKMAGDYVFRNKPTFEVEAKATAEVIYQYNFTKSCILYVNNDYGAGGKDPFKDEFVKLGGTITAEEAYEQGVTDFRTQLTKIKESDCEALYLISYVNDYPYIAKQIKELGLTQNLFSCAAFEDPSLKGKSELEGIIYPYLFDINKDYAPLQNFLKKYEVKYNETPAYQSVISYDALNILIEAMGRCKNPTDTIGIKDKLYEMKDYAGAAGLTSFNEFGDLAYREYNWKIYHEGDFIFLKDYERE